MAHLLQFIIVARIIAMNTAEWIEITQKPGAASSSSSSAYSNRTKSSVKILRKPDANVFFGGDWNTDQTMPSPQWLEYQRERFSNKHNTKPQKLIVSAENHLKNSAQIVVPANEPQNSQKTQHSAKSTSRNQLFQTKTRIDVVNGQADLEVEELPPPLIKVETTSRRDMSYDYDGEVGDDYDNAATTISEQTEQIAQGDNTNQNPADADDDDSFQNSDEHTTDSGVQFPSVQGFFKFLKSIQRTWLKKSNFSIEHKINLLKKLRDNLMRTIEQKFTMLWQPKERQRRRKRGILDESSLNFPPEAALMSINFLTFAVFLIKLVLQVVHIVKSKHYSFTGLNTGTMQTLNRATN